MDPPGQQNDFEQPQEPEQNQGEQNEPDQEPNEPPVPPGNGPPNNDDLPGDDLPEDGLPGNDPPLGPAPANYFYNPGYNGNMNHGQYLNEEDDYADIDPIRLATAAAAAAVGAAQAPRRYLPTPGGREAPVFVATKPKDLFRFLKRYEELCRQCRITTNRGKIENISQYTDAQTESEWQAFDSYDNGTWAEFKDELINSYPEAVDHEEGSVEKLEKVCRNNMRIGIRDQSALMQLKREFMAEVVKLTRTNPPIVSNQSLVRYFVSCLDEGFREALHNRLQIQNVNPIAAGRRRDDLYDLDLVVKTALEMTIGSAGQNFGRQFHSESKGRVSGDLVPIKTEVDSLRQEFATMKDLITIGAQRQKAEHDQIMKALQQRTAQSMGANVQNTQPRTYNNNPNPPRDQGCFFCGESGHFVSNCPSKQTMLDTGRLKVNGGKYTLANGNEIKRTNHGTWKERIEAQEKHEENLSANYFDSLFYHGGENHSSAGQNHEPSIAQLKHEMENLKAQLMGSGGLNYNSQGDINTAYQPSASQKIAKGEAPTILKRDSRTQYVNTRMGTNTGDDQGF